MFIPKVSTPFLFSFKRGILEEIDCQKTIDRNKKYEETKITAKYYPFSNESEEESRQVVDNYNKRSYEWGVADSDSILYTGWRGKVTYDCKLSEPLPWEGKGVKYKLKY